MTHRTIVAARILLDDGALLDVSHRDELTRALTYAQDAGTQHAFERLARAVRVNAADLRACESQHWAAVADRAVAAL